MKLVEAKLTYPNEIFMQPSEEPHPHPFTSRKLCKKKNHSQNWLRFFDQPDLQALNDYKLFFGLVT